MAVVDQAGHLAVEEGHQQRGDMRAVDVGVGHDDDALVAQLVLADIARPCRSRAPAIRSAISWLAAQLVAASPRRRSGSCRARAGSPGSRGRAPAWPSRRRCRLRPGRSRCLRRSSCEQSASLPGRRSLRVAVLRSTSFSWRRRSRSSARSMTTSSKRARGLRVARSANGRNDP